MKRIKITKILPLCAALMSATALAETYVWTGAAGNNRYDDPGNWTVGGVVSTTVPGRYKDSGGTEVGSKEDSVIFGPLTGVDSATIDFANAVSISNFVVQAGAPAYTFGTSSQQTFNIINGVANSSQRAYLTIESGVVTTQTFALAVTFGGQNYYTNVRNDGAEELVFEAGLGTPYNSKAHFFGTGDIRIKNNRATDYQSENKSEGVLIFDNCTSGAFKTIQSTGSQPGRFKIEGENDVLRIGDNASNVGFLAGSAGCRIYGDGLLQVDSRKSNGATPIFYLSSPANKSMFVDTRITFVQTASAYRDSNPECVHVRGAGTIALNNLCTGVHKEMCVGGGGSTAADKSTTLELNYIGSSRDVLSHVGQNVTNLTFAGNGTLSYTGSGETASLPLAGIGDASQTMTLRNNGTGQLQYIGDVSSTHQGLRLRLDAATSKILFAGNYRGEGQFTTVIAGDSGVVMDTPSVCDVYELESGILEFVTSGTYSMSASLSSGSSTLVVPDGASLTINGFSAASGASLDIVMDVVQSHVFLPGYTGDLSLLRINGHAGPELTSGGELVLNASAWASAVNGRWSDGAKWTGGVPSAGKLTLVDAKGAYDYTVTVDEEPAEISNLEIGAGADSPKATVDFQVPVTLATADAVKVLKGGEVKVSQGGQLILGNANAVNLDGGSLDVQPGGSFKWNGSVTFGSGETIFRDGSVITNINSTSNQPLLIGADRAGETARVSISGLGNDINRNYITVGKPVCDGTRAVLDFNNDSDYLENYGNKYFSGNNPYYMAVGFRRGYGEINVSGGSVNIGNMGVYVGTEVDGSGMTNPSADVNCATGVVNVTRGALYVGGNAASYDARQICGFVIGYGAVLKTAELRSQTHYWGELNLSGNGLVGTGSGALVIGAGSADGVVRQSGGRLSMASSVAPVVVGFEGGVGTYDFTDGQIDCVDIYVGGATIDQLMHTSLDESKLMPDRHDAQGTLRLAGGVANVTAGIHVGVDGVGTVEVSGANSTACASFDLTGGNATLAFKLAASGKVGWSFRPAAINIGSGAKLVVDMSECSGVPFGWSKLAEATSVTGTFAPEDISVVLPKNVKHGVEIVYEHNGQPGIWMHAGNGLAIFVR